METTKFTEYRLSRMMLGTVQFGLDYGVANRSGKPAFRQVLAILETALAGGVNCFDTAAAYGESELVLGRALGQLGVLDRTMVVTKVRPLGDELRNHREQAEKAVEESVANSRRHLGIDCLPLVLFHREEDVEYLYVLEKLKLRGWLDQTGVSCGHSVKSATALASRPGLAALQLPASLLDQRHLKPAGGTLATAENHGQAVFIRSLFLQGLLLMPEKEIPTFLKELIPVRRKLTAIAREADLSLAEMAVRYMLSQPGATCLLIGVETEEQVRQNLVLFERGPLPTREIMQIEAVTGDLPQRLITPGLWPG